MPIFEAVLFDFDGVLADTEPIHFDCWAAVLSPAGVSLTWEFYRRHCIGINDRDMVKMVAEAAVPPRSWEELWALYPAKRDLFRRRTLENPPFDAALAPLLERLHGDFKLAVVSASSSSEIEPLLTAGGLRPFFDLVVGGENTPPERHKPAPDPYLLAARRLGVSRALVVEDSPPGVASGRAAGFEVLEIGRAADMPELVLRRLYATPPGGPV
jgi:beta-phosphoglucomutase